MSLPSDILSRDEEALIFNDMNIDVHAIANMLDESNPNLHDENEFKEDHDYKETLQFITVSPPISEQSVPPIITNILSNEEYPGPFEFEVDIYPNGSKNPWVYSPSLNKIFMDMLSPFPVDFKIKNRPHESLFIRITPVYSLPQHSQDFVYRCINHEHPMENSNRGVDKNVCQHIIRCNNSSAIYLGDKEKTERLSIVVPLSFPQTGTDSVREMFHFVCKNSCPTPGMNRRPLEIIFTLEDCSGQILGRHTLRVRICSCPKRDKEKEEKEKNSEKNSPPQGKKRKLEKSEKKNLTSNDHDTKEYTLKLNLVGKHNVQQVVKYCHDLMAGEVLRNVSHGTEGPYKKCLNNLNQLMTKPFDGA